ncbi:hypothetical protein GCM10023354_15740 [Garicola koreensis]
MVRRIADGDIRATKVGTHHRVPLAEYERYSRELMHRWRRLRRLISKPSRSVSESPLLFLDANILASPVTCTLVIAGARADGLILGTELSPTALSTSGLATTTSKDRQVMADAIRADAWYLFTTAKSDR